MATLAISSFGVQLRVGDGTPLAALTITDATNATPIIVETSTAHGVTDVSHADVAGVAGNTGANGSWVVEAVDATHLKLRGSVGNAAYTSGGTLTLDSTYAVLAELTDLQDLGGTAQLVNVTAHDAGIPWGSQIPTFLDTGNMRASVNHVPANAGQTDLWNTLVSRVRRPFMIVLPNGTGAVRTVWWLTASVTGWREGMPVNGALTAQIDLQGAGDLVLANT
jgi:hypothetical protein